MANSFNIVGAGMANLDIVMAMGDFPKENEKLLAQSCVMHGGGPCATAMVAAVRLGAKAAFAGVVGDDANGREIARELAAYDVNTSLLQTKPGESPVSQVLLNRQTASRTIVWTEGTIPEIDPDDVPDAAFSGAEFLHLDGHHNTAALALAKRARALGLRVSLDAGSLREGVPELLPFVDILVPSEKFVRQYTGHSNTEKGAKEICAAFAPGLFAVTQGERGGLACAGGEWFRYRAFAVDAVDSNGAGDVFHGALLAALCRGLAPRAALDFASAATALKCTRVGARESVPTWERTMAFLEENGWSAGG